MKNPIKEFLNAIDKDVEEFLEGIGRNIERQSVERVLKRHLKEQFENGLKKKEDEKEKTK